MNFFEIVGIVAGIAVAIPTIPQVVQTIRTKNVKGLSLSMYCVRAFGGLCWIIYGRYLGSRQMQIFNAISASLSLTMVFLIWRYRNKNK